MNLYERRKKFNEQAVDRMYCQFEKNIYDNNLFRRCIKRKIENADRFKKFLSSNVPQIKIAAITILAENIDDLTFLDDLINEEEYVIETILKIIAGREEYVDLMASLLNENSAFLTNMIINLKKMGKEEYLTALLFSDNIALVEFIKRIVDNG